MKLGFLFLIAPLLTLLAGCTGVPRGVKPVEEFEADRYLGKWYEIARLDHSFERGMTHVTADYTRNPDGSIAVLNRGWKEQKKTWKEARARAVFQGDETVGSLTVTFRWPFSGGYHVIALDREEYQWAMVSGPNREYLWILAREKTLDAAVIEKLVNQARDLGYPVEGLIFVRQDPPVEVGSEGGS